MSLLKFKISFIRREFSQRAATATIASSTLTSDSHHHSSESDKKKLSFAKSLYIGNFVKEIFTKKINKIDPPICTKYFNINVPKEFGGLELPSTAISEVYKNIGFLEYRDHMVHGSVVKCINTHGTLEQKKIYLPLLASGKSVATFCMYEYEHGYDIQNTKTKASFVNGKWIIDGTKNWVVNGTQADMFLVLAKTMDECNRPENNENFFSAFLVKKSKNIKIVVDGDYHNVTFNNVEAESMLAPENEGLLLYAMLFSGDLLESSSAVLAELKKVIQNASQNVQTYDRSGLIKLGKLHSHVYTLDCVLRFTSLIVDEYNFQSDYELILARLFANKTTHCCLNLLNDLGQPKNMYTYIENSLLYDGKSNLLSFVGALLGIQYAGQFMAEDVRQLRNPLMFPKYTLTHILKIQRALKDKPKLNHYLEKYMHPSLKKQAVDLEYCLTQFQFAVQYMFINLGPDTCYFQMILERANCIAMDLYALSAVLQYISQKLYHPNAKQYTTELMFVNVFCSNIREECNRRIKEILDAPHNVIDPHLKTLGKNCFEEKNYYLEHPLKRNII